MDWYHDHTLNLEQQDKLAGLEEYRIEYPVIWALLCGMQTSRSIAKHICWPHEDVMIELRRLKAEDLVYDYEGIGSVLWQFNADETEHIEYQNWVLRQKQRGGLFNPPPRGREQRN
jgi:hypothetical protein